jgi:SAM-dependent methyltransferase
MGEKHFYEQKEFTTSYLLSYFQKHLPKFKHLKILEVGCAEAGFLDVLYEMNIEAIGLEIEPERVKLSKEKNPHIKIFEGDITDDNIVNEIGDTFDLIVMRDVIEHIPDRLATFSNIKKLLKKNGYLYVTFPPKFSGFAGHQQNGISILRFVPYLHLLPEWIIKVLGKFFKERSRLVESVMLNYNVGLTIRDFEKYYSQFNFLPIRKELFLFRPIYKLRFNISPRKIPNVPFIREFIAFGCEYLLKNNE